MSKITYPICYKLEYPVGQGENVISELLIPRPKGKHIKYLTLKDTPSLEEMMVILGKLTGEAPSVIDELDWQDLQNVLDIMGKVLAPSPQTSKKP